MKRQLLTLHCSSISDVRKHDSRPFGLAYLLEAYELNDENSIIGYYPNLHCSRYGMGHLN
jgi:hypothetical protein